MVKVVTIESKRSMVFALLISSLAVFPPSSGQAEGVIQLTRTGQTACYDARGNVISCSGTGQDGEIQAGALWPSPRFAPGTGAEADCMIDNLTGLMWPKSSLPGSAMTWNDAVDYPQTLTLCGHSDWRLPNINELESLVTTPYWLSTQGFASISVFWYWSSSSNADGPWHINVDQGHMSNGNHGPFWVLPVRSGQPGPFGKAAIWRTGQTISYHTGDDGDLKQGISWPSPRFSDKGNGEVTDNLTGLVWTKKANAPGPDDCSPAVTKTWQKALDYVKCLNTNNYLGYSDWRLPNRKELRSLSDYSQKYPALPPGHPFTVASNYFYWSSSTYAGDTDRAWTIDMGTGIVDRFNKESFSYSVWPVHAGLSVPVGTLVISKSGTGSGTVASAPSGILCGIDCSEAYSLGTLVTLTAQPNAGSAFSGWSGGGCSGTGNCVVTMNAAKSVNATFSFTTEGVVKLPQTGQTECYEANGTIRDCSGSGQDGELRAGVIWPEMRFADNGDQTVTDSLTGLVWTRDGNAPGPAVCNPGGFKMWQTALDYVKCLNSDNYLGHKDWRLPNRKELQSLAHAGQPNTASWLNLQGFTNAQAYPYWSSSTAAGGVYSASNAWLVDMSGGNVFPRGKSSGYHVWPVRTGQGSSMISLPRTGQTTCYNASGGTIDCPGTGQDGDLQSGAVWPETRFADNGDQTMTDNLTGLIWTKEGNLMKIRDPSFDADSSPGDGMVTWQYSLDYIKKLNQENYLGQNDWRLPNFNELESLVHTGQPYQANWLNMNGFTNVQGANPYRSSDTDVMGRTFARLVWMGGGMVSGTDKSYEDHYVWPVRSHQSAAFAVLLVSLTGAGTGTVTSNPDGIACGSQCRAYFNPGKSMTLAAQAATGYAFGGWSGGGCQGMESCTVTLSTDTTVSATFIKGPVGKGDINYDVQVNLADAISALQVIAGISPQQTVYKEADVDGDVKIGLAEVIYILQKAAGIR